MWGTIGNGLVAGGLGRAGQWQAFHRICQGPSPGPLGGPPQLMCDGVGRGRGEEQVSLGQGGKQNSIRQLVVCFASGSSLMHSDHGRPRLEQAMHSMLYAMFSSQAHFPPLQQQGGWK